ncbi:MAG: CDP-glucose 4,6-dehydratase [Hydrogenothermaceae bacterium]|nr:CDP-glucose 4,6-dehydratase [Hydrogenothermaceae bacterium]
MLLEKFYKGKKVFITGNTGFKGSWLTLWLKYFGAEVIGYSLPPPTNPNLFEILDLEKDIVYIVGDVRDIVKLKESIKIYRPDIVIHMAAQPLVRYSYLYPKETYEINVIGTLNLFEAVRECDSVRVVINVTSDKCYENKEWVYGYREEDPMGGYDPYSSSKGCAELLTSAYRNSFFNPKDYGVKHNVSVASVRAGNVIGGGDWSEDRLIPDCIRALSKNETIKLRKPEAVRPWQHVLEPLSGYLYLAYKMWKEPTKYSGGWNFGPEDDDIITVEEIVKLVVSIWGKGEYSIIRNEDFHEAALLKLDTSKAHFYLKWNRAYDVKTSLFETVEWYKNFYQGKISMFDFTIEQIKKYVRTAKEHNILWATE